MYIHVMCVRGEPGNDTRVDAAWTYMYWWPVCASVFLSLTAVAEFLGPTSGCSLQYLYLLL